MHICFVIEYYYPHIGGAEILFQNLVEGLVGLGHECSVVTCRLPNTRKDEVVNGVNVHRVWVPTFGDRYWFTFLSLFSAWRYGRKAEIIHTMTYNGVLVAWLVSMLQNKPLFITVFEVIGKKWHKLGLSSVKAFVFRLIERVVLAFPYDSYSCISRNTMAALQEYCIPAKKLFLAYPGIDYKLFSPTGYPEKSNQITIIPGKAPETFLYTYYGRPGFVKGVEYLVRAIPEIRQKIPHSRLLLILSRKPENLYKKIIQLIEALGLKIGEDLYLIDSVPRDQLPLYLRASDCIVVPSLNEGFGFSCVEACTLGLPVVVTSAGSLPEVVFGKYVIVEPADSSAIARGVASVFNREWMVSGEKIFSWENYIERHVEVYNSELSIRSQKG
ncbi:MAG: glycosyltransferase family 4 protein [Nitrospirae bacterium]|nr:glycosyltransferase family 4 protein [Nitrospirota bacterium]